MNLRGTAEYELFFTNSGGIAGVRGIVVGGGVGDVGGVGGVGVAGGGGGGLKLSKCPYPAP